jgi:hypothetical protein
MKGMLCGCRNVETQNSRATFEYLGLLYLIMGLVLLVFSGWVDPICEIRTLLTVWIVHTFIGFGYVYFARKFINSGFAIIVTLILLYMVLLLRSPVVFCLSVIMLLYIALRQPTDKKDCQFYSAGMIILIVSGIVFSMLILTSAEGFDFLIESNIMWKAVWADIFYHADIVAMIKQSGTVSTGLHGSVTPIASHVFSHRIIALVSSLGKISILNTYGYVFLINFASIVFIAIIGCAEDLSPSRTRANFFLRILVLGLLLAGILSSSRLRINFVDDFYLSSQSYNIALSFFLGVISSSCLPSKKWRLFGMGIGAVFAAYTKISVGIMASGLLVIELWRLRRSLNLIELVGSMLLLFLVGLEALLLLAGDGAVHGSGVNSDLFYNLRYYLKIQPELASVLLFLFHHFVFVWVAIGFTVFVLMDGLELDRDVFIKCYSFNILGLLAGVSAVFLLKSSGGGFAYFSNISMFTAIPFILIFSSSGFVGHRLKKICSTCVLSVLMMVVALIGMSMEGCNHLWKGADRILSDRKSAFVRDEFGDYIQHLKTIRNDPRSKNYLVYVPKKETAFWDDSRQNFKCWYSFYIPAVSETAALFGLPKTKDYEITSFWGFGNYDRGLLKLGDLPEIPAADLNRETRKLGFSGYVQVESDGVTWHPVK